MESIWSQFLGSSKLPTIDKKTLLIVGESPDQQNGLIRRIGESRATDQKTLDGHIRYTYIEHTDSDDNLNCLISVYSIPGEPESSVSPLLERFKRLLPKDLFVFILIDAVKLRQQLSERANAKGNTITAVIDSLQDLRDWLLLLKSSTNDQDICSWFDTMTKAYKNDTGKNEGECDMPLGFRGAVILTSSEALDYFDDEYNVSLTSFLIDQLQQVLRVICLKHGLALYYSSVEGDDFLHSLIVRNFDIKNLGKSPPLAIPPQSKNLSHLSIPEGWDSWGKIGTVNEDLDLQKCSTLWTDELTRPTKPQGTNQQTNLSTSFVLEFEQFLAECYKEQRTRLKEDMQKSDKVETSITDFHQQFSVDQTSSDTRAKLFKEFFSDLIKKST